jgi:hypothetical protein
MLARLELPELGASSEWAASFSSRRALGHKCSGTERRSRAEEPKREAGSPGKIAASWRVG